MPSLEEEFTKRFMTRFGRLPTPGRKAVLKAIVAADRVFCANDIDAVFIRPESEEREIARSTVFRTIQMLLATEMICVDHETSEDVYYRLSDTRFGDWGPAK